LASNCEKDVNLESEMGDNPPNFNMEDYLFNDEVLWILNEELQLKQGKKI
jgi:hypothetical protein